MIKIIEIANSYGQNPKFILAFMLSMFIIVLCMFISMHGDEEKNVLCSKKCFDSKKLIKCTVCPLKNPNKK